MEKPARALHPVITLLERRWSPRAFSPRPVDGRALSSLLEAARWAPSAMNEQPWRFIVASRERQAEFLALASCLSPRNQEWARGAAVLIAVVARESFSRNGRPNPHAWYDTGQAVAHLSVQATAMELSVHQMAGFSADAVRQAFAVPEGFAPVSVIAIGYVGEPEQLTPELAERERAPRERLDPAELFFAGRWGAPLGAKASSASAT